MLTAFVLLIAVEDRRGIRFLAVRRDHFDARVARASFILQHVDWGAFFNDVARTGFERALHDVAHATLIAVRFVERVLTRTVRSLRMRRLGEVSATEPMLPKQSRIAGTVLYLKSALKRTRRAPKALRAQEGVDVVEL